MKKILLSLIMFIVVVGAGLGGLGFYVYSSDDYNQTLNKEAVPFSIEKGETGNSVVAKLANEGLLRNELVVKGLIKIKKTNLNVIMGDYEIQPNEDLESLFARFNKGDVVEVEMKKLVFLEGYTTDQYFNVIKEGYDYSYEDFISLGKQDYWFLEGRELDEHYFDGVLFPDTYQFKLDASPQDMLNIILNKTKSILDQYKEQMTAHDLSVNELLTMASMIEKEALHDEDRPSIAGVIYNRLETNMLLQIDATVLAAVGHKQTVTYEDLKVDSPYNTYKYKGLPPTPIAMPSKASIDAALNPNDHEYIYYVANRKTGLHHFAVTYEEHNENIEKYWKIKE